MKPTISKLLAAGAVAGVLGLGGVSVASAQDDSSTETPSTEAPSPEDHGPRDENCPNMGEGSADGTSFDGRGPGGHGGPHGPPGTPPAASGDSSGSTGDSGSSGSSGSDANGDPSVAEGL